MRESDIEEEEEEPLNIEELKECLKNNEAVCFNKVYGKFLHYHPFDLVSLKTIEKLNDHDFSVSYNFGINLNQYRVFCNDKGYYITMYGRRIPLFVRSKQTANSIKKKEEIQQQKESKMKNMKEAVQKGVKIGAAQKASRTLTKALKKMLGKNYPEFFKTPIGKVLEPLVAPILIMFIIDHFGLENQKVEKLYQAAQLALTGETASQFQTVVDLFLPQIDSLIEQLPEV